jgi:hypothetical protein
VCGPLKGDVLGPVGWAGLDTGVAGVGKADEEVVLAAALGGGPGAASPGTRRAPEVTGATG